MTKTRTETDSFGPIEVPADRYWGAQTQRSLQNFRIGGDRMPDDTDPRLRASSSARPPKPTCSSARSTRSAASAIVAAAQEVIDGKLDDHFPLVVWQTGSGTQTNMNLNEVIANRANEMLGAPLGAKTPVHPNDHVNMSQSSNDSFPTAMHIAAAMEIANVLIPALEHHARGAAREGKGVREDRQDRPHPYPGCDPADARPGIFRLCRAGEERHRAHEDGAARNSIRWRRAAPRSAPGSTPSRNLRGPFAKRAAKITGLPFVSAQNKFEALAAHDAYVFVHGALNSVATGLFKIANDIRLLGSGPRSGLGELILPENEPGSSIMPGKVNPTQAEALTMVCCQVFGNHTTITVAASQGHFELNVFKPVIAFAMLQSIRLLADAARSFTDNCIVGIARQRSRASAN